MNGMSDHCGWAESHSEICTSAPSSGFLCNDCGRRAGFQFSEEVLSVAADYRVSSRVREGLKNTANIAAIGREHQDAQFLVDRSVELS